METAVPQELVIAAIIAIIHPRPVLIKSNAHIREVEIQLDHIVESLVGSCHPVVCTSNLTWPEILATFAAHMDSGVVLRRVDRLNRSVQLHLGYSLMQPDTLTKEFLKSSALLFTTNVILDKMNPFLRRQILMKQDTSTLDIEGSLVELPTSSAIATNKKATLTAIQKSMLEVSIVPELLRYMQDILIFVRTHRFAHVGLRPQASSDFELLVRTLCALRGSNIATPVTIKDAARLSIPVHVTMTSAEDEPSLQYGGNFNLVKGWIKEWDGEVLVDYILDQVPVPR